MSAALQKTEKDTLSGDGWRQLKFYEAITLFFISALNEPEISLGNVKGIGLDLRIQERATMQSNHIQI